MSVPAPSSNISGKQGTTIVNTLTVTPRQHSTANPSHNAHRLSTPNASLPGFDIARTVQIGAASVTVNTTPPSNRCRSTPHDSAVPQRQPPVSSRHGNLSPPSRTESANPETGPALFSSAAAAAPGLVISIASATAALKQMKILFGVPLEFSLSSTFNKVVIFQSQSKL